MEAQRNAAVATMQEEPAEAALEQRVAGGEKALSATEFTELIALADSLRQYDERKSISPGDGLQERMGGNGYSVATAYEVAKELGIDANYLKRAEHILFPTAEMQLADIKKFGAKPTTEIIARKYIERLEQALQIYHPGSKIKTRWTTDFMGDHQYLFTTVEEQSVPRRFLGFRKTEKRRTNIAQLKITTSSSFSEANIEFTIYNPSFFPACGEELDELKRKFREIDYSISHRYNFDYAVKSF